MNILGIPLARFLIFLASLIFLVHGVFLYVKRTKFQSIVKLLTTVFIWGSIGLIAYNPDIAYFASSKLGFGDNLNTLIFVAFMVVFAVLFRILRLLEKIEKDITEIIRKDALKVLRPKS